MLREAHRAGKRAVVLLSGGIDSSTVLAVTKADGYELYALSFDYNQRHRRELISAGRVALSIGVEKHLCIDFDLRDIGGSALTSDMEVPKKHESLPPHDRAGKKRDISPPSVPITYVPARNTIFLSFALAWAEVLKAEDIFIGANAIDYSGYPDCRPEYIEAFEDMANLATKASVEGKTRFRINAPLISMKKSEIVRTGAELGLDYSLTWSCYDPQPVPPPSISFAKGGKRGGNNAELVPCGKCDSCIFRAKGFEEAGMEDPLINWP